ncbi:MAG TPA: cytochrome c [Candidatus Acidoferrales bacterium]|nr:cytochrome c [Candidatus Acidoferrales bacterium]
MRWCNFVLLTIVGSLLTASSASAQAADHANVGRTATADDIRSWNLIISPSGKELPVGNGTAKEGAQIFAAKCARCHGPAGEGTQFGPRLTGGQGSLNTLQPVRTIGSYWPFATTVWDYINRAMPRGNENTLKPDEIYSLTAFILFRNGIVQETDVMDAKTLPKVKMPNRDGFLPPRLEDIANLQKRGCAAGHCP